MAIVREKNLVHGEWKKHKYIRKYKSKKSGNTVYVYKGKGTTKPNPDIPKSWNPDMEPATFGSKEGYVYNGFFFEGDYNAAKNSAFEFYTRLNQLKAEAAMEDLQSTTVKGKAKKLVDDISTALDEIAGDVGDFIEKGKGFIFGYDQ